MTSSHPSSRPDTSTVSSVAEYHEKPAISYGVLRTAVIGLLAVACVIGSLLLYWLHKPATPTPVSAGQLTPPTQVSAR